MNLRKEFLVKPDCKVRLKDYDPEETYGYEKGKKIEALTEKALKEMDSLQYLLYAEKKHALLVIFQALDAGGKDGTIRHVMSGLNPQGTVVASFKQPSAEELAHDFLWRVHKVVPTLGDIGVFNRSHYEDVLVVRVHNLVPKEVWSARYEQINSFERILSQNGVAIVKFFLHISKEEQKRRFEKRIDDPDRRWKISPSDFAERKYWDDYTEAYEDALRKCSTEEAPWYIVPANHKWFRNFAVSQILVETLQDLKMKYPKPVVDVRDLKWK